jgi:Cytochrome b(C-terminal)/b6/petD
MMASQDGNGSGIVMRAQGASAGGAARTPAPVVGPSKRSEVPIKKAGGGIEEKLHTWPFLVRSEFMMSILIIIILTIWSLMLNAPLEQPSNPTRTPNPSKAPWYFLGLQEMLVFFDPWYAGVVLPSFIIVGLMLIPYLDINPKGNGYYTLRERWFEIMTFFMGFHILWVSFIIIGTFFRGPGWNWFWPGQVWDPHLVEALTNVDLPYMVGIRDYMTAAIFGLMMIVLYFVLAYVALYYWIKSRPAGDPWSAFPGGGPEILEKWGPVRFGITGFLLIAMVGVFIKMALRHALNIKYILVTPWINI